MTKFASLKSAPSRTELINDLQRLFNRYIRQRDSGLPCIYCGKPITKTGEHVGTAAHYLPVSTSWALRFDPDNVHVAGLVCNMHDNRVKYRENLVKIIGEERVSLLERQQYSLAKMTTGEIVEKIEHFKNLKP